ncbi:hypothetical protein [Amycolatopsis pigmentata]|uniref:Transmembrane protein n=1 Tax=Amycolatopsis pigmentata TaxID=450801 RepID=A0ABW5G8U7_9PSEU
MGGIACETGLTAMLAASLGVVAIGCATFAAVVNAACFGTDHVHDWHWRCRVEQRPGEFFYRTNDFASLGSAVRGIVGGLLDSVHQLHTTPARAWLPVGVPREAHLVVWEVLCCLDRTRTARVVADQLRGDHEATAFATQVDEAIAVIDDAVGEALWYLHDTVTLAQAWTTKLAYVDLETRVQDTLSSLRNCDVARIAAAAEVLPQNVFAFITAARDVTGTGLFPWEKAEAFSSAALDFGGDARTDTDEDDACHGGFS